MHKHWRSRSSITFREVIPHNPLQDDTSCELWLAKSIDILKANQLKAIAGKVAIFKTFRSAPIENNIFLNIIKPLNSRYCNYQEDEPEIEFKKRLESINSFLQVEGEFLRSEAFYTVIENAIEEIKPALLLELYHPCFETTIKDFASILKTDWCHIHLIALATECYKIIRKENNQEFIANKIRKFFIPILGILSVENYQEEPEIVKSVEKILKYKKTQEILEQFPCDKDLIQLEIDEVAVPSLLDFDIKKGFFNKCQKKSKQTAKGISELQFFRENSKNKSKELCFRRCASSGELAKKSYQKRRELVFNLLAASESHYSTSNSIRLLLEKEIYSKNYHGLLISDIPPNFSANNPNLAIFFSRTSFPSSIQAPSEINESYVTERSKLDHPFNEIFDEVLHIEESSPNPREWMTLFEDSLIAIYCKALSDKGLLLMRTYAMLSIPPKELYNKFITPAISSRNKGAFRKIKLIESKPHFELYSYRLMPYAGIVEREFIVRRSYMDDFPGQGESMIVIKSIDVEETGEVKRKFPLGRAFVSGMILRPSDNGGTKLSYILKCQLGGLIPLHLLYNYFTAFVKEVISDCENISKTE
ncbi:unnamed protein product [Blepharisma stoltei]|uniref:START domain-containing protein n=1 Tax=Blepharisma stoltei TaxID=1481888 RepID=A0AAU9JYH9_9CILI|nr:unnamed protein product [Blepharisma stoltei]